MTRGGTRSAAGRPPTAATPRTPVTWRLPMHLVNAAHRRAELEGITVTRWIEIAIERRLKEDA
jgi:predicted DNA binding CopG/RHH family protein